MFQKCDIAFKFKDHSFELKASHSTHETNGNEFRRQQAGREEVIESIGGDKCGNKLPDQGHFYINQTIRRK